MPSGRTSRPGLQATDLLATHQACSGRRQNHPCRRHHECKLGDQTRDDADKEPREELSCGRSQTSLYNSQRPHEALQLAVPASRYQPSPRDYVETVAPFEYASDDIVRRVQQGGHISFLGRALKVPKAFRGKAVAFRPTTQDGVFDVVFRTQRIATIDIRPLDRKPKSVHLVPGLNSGRGLGSYALGLAVDTRNLDMIQAWDEDSS